MAKCPCGVDHQADLRTQFPSTATFLERLLGPADIEQEMAEGLDELVSAVEQATTEAAVMGDNTPDGVLRRYTWAAGKLAMFLAPATAFLGLVKLGSEVARLRRVQGAETTSLHGQITGQRLRIKALEEYRDRLVQANRDLQSQLDRAMTSLRAANNEMTKTLNQ